MLKRIRWKLIDKWWPKGKPFVDAVRGVKGRHCKACGSCCALICIQADQEYMSEQNRMVRILKSMGEDLTPDQKRSLRDYEFVIKYWVRVPRDKAQERGFVKTVDSYYFIYHCLLLTEDGKCGAHDKFRPLVCEDYPFYNGDRTVVRIGCGFADGRCRGNKPNSQLPILTNT